MPSKHRVFTKYVQCCIPSFNLSVRIYIYICVCVSISMRGTSIKALFVFHGIVRAMLVCGFFEVSSPSFEAYLRFVKCVRGGSPTTDWHQESHLGGPWQSWNQERGCGMVNLVQWHPKLTSWELLQLNPPQTNQLGAEKTTNSGWFIIPIQQEGPPKSQHPGKPKALLPTCCQS